MRFREVFCPRERLFNDQREYKKERTEMAKNLDGATCKVAKSLNRCYTLPLGTSQSATSRRAGEEVSES